MDELQLLKLTPAELVDRGICPTCLNRKYPGAVYGDNTDKLLYADKDIECFFVGNPRARGHMCISSAEHYHDLSEAPDILNEKIIRFCKQCMLNQIILVYCRSGNRSKQAAEKMTKMGYVNLYEFGGIIDWTGEVATGQTLTLTVKSNPTTGFSWEVEQDQELFDIQSDYLAEPQSGPVSGAGGWQRFLLTPKASGTVHLTFAYARPWENGGSAAQFSCAVEISEELMITVNEDELAAAAESGYQPTVTIY